MWAKAGSLVQIEDKHVRDIDKISRTETLGKSEVT
jgi:hypothetical protein